MLIQKAVAVLEFNSCLSRLQQPTYINTDILKFIFINETFCTLIQISEKFVLMGPIHIKSLLVQVMTWYQIGDKPLSETMPTHITDAYIRHMGEMT